MGGSGGRFRSLEGGSAIVSAPAVPTLTAHHHSRRARVSSGTAPTAAPGCRTMFGSMPTRGRYPESTRPSDNRGAWSNWSSDASSRQSAEPLRQVPDIAARLPCGPPEVTCDPFPVHRSALSQSLHHSLARAPASVRTSSASRVRSGAMRWTGCIAAFLGMGCSTPGGRPCVVRDAILVRPDPSAKRKLPTFTAIPTLTCRHGLVPLPRAIHSYTWPPVLAPESPPPLQSLRNEHHTNSPPTRSSP